MRLVSLLLSFVLSTAIQAYHNDHDYGIGSNLRQLQSNMTVLPEEIRTTIRDEITYALCPLPLYYLQLTPI